jgi:hypothetical protein
MDATTVDSLFALIAVFCVVLLLYGGWLCLRYGRATPSFRGGEEAMVAAARAAAGMPAGTGLHPEAPAGRPRGPGGGALRRVCQPLGVCAADRVCAS